jgi:hypothetical protein
MAANPFGVAAFTDGPKSKIVVKEGQTLRLRYGVLIHDGFDEPEAAIEGVFKALFGSEEG